MPQDYDIPQMLDSLTALQPDHSEELQIALTKAVRALMQERFEQLLQICYRMDLPEDKVRQAVFEDPYPAESLAALMIQRQRLRLELRRKFAEREKNAG